MFTGVGVGSRDGQSLPSSMAQISSNDASALLYGGGFRIGDEQQELPFRSPNLQVIQTDGSRTLLNQVKDILKEVRTLLFNEGKGSF